MLEPHVVLRVLPDGYVGTHAGGLPLAWLLTRGALGSGLGRLQQTRAAPVLRSEGEAQRVQYQTNRLSGLRWS